MLILELYIGNLLIDSVEVDVTFCETVRAREDQVKDVRIFMLKENLDKIFASNPTIPTFILIGTSKVNQIIQDDTERDI